MINIISNYASMARMTYADDLNGSKENVGLRGKLFEKLGDEGVTKSQAELFSEKYRVIYQDNENESQDNSGFSATLPKSSIKPTA